jgi:hypothetical protein
MYHSIFSCEYSVGKNIKKLNLNLKKKTSFHTFSFVNELKQILVWEDYSATLSDL